MRYTPANEMTAEEASQIPPGPGYNILTDPQFYIIIALAFVAIIVVFLAIKFVLKRLKKVVPDKVH